MIRSDRLALTLHPPAIVSQWGEQSLGRRLLGALTAHVGVSRVLGGIAILAALAVGLLLSSVGPLQAQEDSTIEYPENGTGAVAAYTAVDPEKMGAVTWSLKGDVATDDDEDFKIDKASGVLSFMKSPDYEMATGGGATNGASNTYTVTVIATDADGVPSEKAVMVEVTNVDEAGKVSLDKVAPYPGIELMAALSDPDLGASASQWQWSRSMSKNGSYADIEDDAEAACLHADERRRGLLPEGDGFIRRRRGRRQERYGNVGPPGAVDQFAERHS